jgi:hypothetical protein
VPVIIGRVGYISTVYIYKKPFHGFYQKNTPRKKKKRRNYYGLYINFLRKNISRKFVQLAHAAEGKEYFLL